MAKIIKSICIFLAAIAFVNIAVAPQGEAALTCSNVASYMRPCNSYLTNKGPLGECCAGVKSLNSAASTTAARQTTCNCLKSFAKSYSGVSASKASGLARLCGVDVPYKITPSIDCSKVN